MWFLLVLVVQATAPELSILSIALQMEGCGGKSRFCATYFEMDHANELSNSLKESANINTVRASLIVEECTRLGFGGVSLLLLLLQVTN
ncbi:uncharacterized protein [Glycine max]|uniref:uncharacterized protein isoform X2 n=1 Tax=Glycine max TaxID=3847 RepID=UPI001B357535|nr:uncharacterized protein LOC102661143 isoform X2 [Glycine max]